VASVVMYAISLVEDDSVSPSGPEVFLTLGGGTLLTLAISAVTLPLGNATTRYNAVRYE
jgi:hypothetical protein